MKHLDMRGNPCPIPVVRARRALQAGEDCVLVDVDNAVAVENLKKMAAGEGHAFSCEPLEDGAYRVRIGSGTPGAASPAPETARASEAGDAPGVPLQGTVLLVSAERLGEGDPALGALLMKGFLFAQTELTSPPDDVIFVNGGARLTCEGAPTVPDLVALEARGARIWTCGTCANFFGIADRLAVGQITDMMNIARMLSGAARVVTV